LWFTARFVQDYREFTRSPARAEGTVVAIEDAPANASGSVTTPVAVVEYTDAHGEKRRVRSGGGAGLHVDETVTVVDGRVARVRDLRNGGAVSMLFGTFPFSMGVFFLFGWLHGERPPRATRADRPAVRFVTGYANLALFLGILWAGFRNVPVLEGIREGFMIVSFALWLHCANGVVARGDPRWTLGMGILALNFTAWVVAIGLFDLGGS